MACSDQISTTDLENASLDAKLLAEVATSRTGGVSSGALISQTSNRFGETTPTTRGQLAKIAYEPPVAYAGSIAFTVDDGAKTIERSGIIYAPLISSLPLTTTGTWSSSDEDNFYAIQKISPTVETYAQLDAITTQATGSVIIVTGVGISGQFVVDDGAHTANVGTIRDFTSAVGNQHLRRLYSGVVNVKWFGAAGDGVTDDHSAFQAALDASDSVYCAGQFFLSASLAMNTHGQALEGVGMGSTTLKFADNVSGVNMLASRQQIKNMTLSNASGLSTSGSAISANLSSNSFIDNVFIDGFFNAITIKNSQAFKVINSAMWYFTNFGLYLIGNLNNDYYFQNLFINGGARGGGAGAATHGIRLIDKNDAMMFVNVENILCHYALTTDQTVGSKPAYCRFINCFFDSATNGVLLDKTKEFTFDSCWFSNRPGNGISLFNSSNTLFNACTFANGGGNGAQVSNTCVDTKFIGCKFLSNGTAGGGNDRGLWINANTIRFIVSGCEFINGGGFGASQAIGLYVGSGCDLYSISDNIIKDNWSAQVADASTPAEGYWSNNIGYTTKNHGQQTVSWDGSGQATIAHGLAKTPNFYSAFTLNGGATEAELVSADATNITVRGRNTTNNTNSTGSYIIKWMAEV